MGGMIQSVLMACLLPAVHAHAVTVKLTDADASSTVSVHVGDRIRLELATEPAKGYRWSAKTIDASHLEQVGKAVMPESGRLDAAGTQNFVWKAISPGDAQVALEYRRPSDDRTVPPGKTVVLRVAVAAGELAPIPPGVDELTDPVVQPLATYRGKLPCSGCLAQSVLLRLLAHDPAGGPAAVKAGIFVKISRFQGAAGGDRTVAETGQFAVIHGTYADPSMTLYVLGSAEGGTENFRVEPDRLVPLDPQGLPIPVPAGHETALRRAPDDAF